MTDYIPLDCSLHDHLEALSTLCKRCQIVYQQADGQRTETVDTIADIYTKNKEEFVVLGGGKVIRLDALIKVNGLSFIGFDSYSQ